MRRDTEGPQNICEIAPGTWSQHLPQASGKGVVWTEFKLSSFKNLAEIALRPLWMPSISDQTKSAS